MQVEETKNEGLSRSFKVVVPASHLDEKLNAKLEEIKGQVQLKGFRPGKVPLSFLKKTYGKSMMGEIVEQTISETSQKTLTDRELRAALQPKIDLVEQDKVEEIMSGKADLAYTMDVELVPDFEPADPSGLSVERPVAEVSEEEVDEALQKVAQQQKSFEPKPEGEAAEEGDAVTIDFVGKIDGEAFEGGSAEGHQLELGSKTFIPGFEEQLVGVKKGDTKEVTVTFPEEYGATHLAGKEATFDVTVQEVSAAADTKIDDAFAERLGLENLDKLKELMRNRLGDEFKAMSRTHLKRHILDALDEKHDFDLPEGMVDAEFNQIWQHVEDDLKRQNKSFEDEDVNEEEMRADYRRIAERRVRLGLVLAELGRRNNISVTQEELNRALAERARQFPGQERQVYEFYQKQPGAIESLRAPIFEDKVIDYIIELADVTDKTVDKDELMQDPDDDMPMPGHDHDHDHDHD
jgi:trigger factor